MLLLGLALAVAGYAGYRSIVAQLFRRWHEVAPHEWADAFHPVRRRFPFSAFARARVVHTQLQIWRFWAAPAWAHEDLPARRLFRWMNVSQLGMIGGIALILISFVK